MGSDPPRVTQQISHTPTMRDLTGECQDAVLEGRGGLAESRRASGPSGGEGYLGPKGNTLAQFSPLTWPFLS